jgi:hypothetical protein
MTLFGDFEEGMMVNPYTLHLRSVALALLVAGALMGLLVACGASTPDAPTATVSTVAVATPATTTAEATAAETTPGVAETDVTATVDVEEPASDQTTLVVHFEGASRVVRTLDFTEPISGLALLEQSDLDVVKAEFDWGTAVCSIEGVGCPADDCFCQENAFWSYLFWDGDAWASYPVGPAQSLISTTGTVEGWQWSTGENPVMPPIYAEAADQSLNWLRAQQVITDGSYGSSVGASVESLLALGANHEDADAWRPSPDVPSLLEFVTENAPAYSQEGVSEAGKLAVALTAMELCWPADALMPTAYYSPTIGALHPDAGRLAWGILGTLALDQAIPADSVAYLNDLALPEGGWEWSPGWGRDTNSTALAIQALIAADTPVTATTIVSGLAYLRLAQTDAGGFSYDPGADFSAMADANSTAYAVQALVAAGENPLGEEWQKAEGNPLDFLLAQQDATGGLAWQAGQPANAAATQQAIPALLGQPYPIRQATLPICGGP